MGYLTANALVHGMFGVGIPTFLGFSENFSGGYSSANNSNEITAKELLDVVFGGKELNAGTYSLFTIPSYDGDWTVIINKAKNLWGSYYYNKDEDVMKIDKLLNDKEEIKK